jgi:steroid delta-isomerase-like uncharacterized protein
MHNSSARWHYGARKGQDPEEFDDSGRSKQMAEAQNKTIARRFNEEVWGRGDQAVLEELLDPDFVDHDALPGQAPGREGHKQILAAFHSAFPDLNVTTEDIVTEGEKVVSRWTARGTHHGELLGIAPTGNGVTIKGIDVLRVAEGRIVERWSQFNSLEMMQQLGAVPMPEQSEESSPT